MKSIFGVALLSCMGLWACGKSEPAGTATRPETSAEPVTSSPPAAATQALFAEPPSGSEPPSSFASGTKVSVENAVGLGCEAKSSAGFIQLLCRKKNGTGGKPLRAILDADAGTQVDADEQGELRLTLPYRAGAAENVLIEWTDTKYWLRVSDASAKLEWAAANLEHRRACAKVLDESRNRLSAAQKADQAGRVLPAEAAKLPRLGVCHPAGMGSWALGLKQATGSGEASSRSLKLELELYRVNDQGKVLSAPYATFEFAPGGFELKPLTIYDYDGDGNHEVIVPYELKSLPAGVTPAAPAAIWSFSETAITPYASSPSLGPGAVIVEQLDFDMRPDLGGYAPQVAWLGGDCGLQTCPPRLTGPVFFVSSLADGSFARSAASTAALQRACGKKPPEAVVVESAGTLNATQIAKNLTCSRAFGTSSSAVVEELGAKQAALCGEKRDCVLLTTLRDWANAPAPISLTAGGTKP